ncbi:calcium-binding protein [Microvirga sp. Mcv34]|uniref:calcium-binding protein n=1 Tax=Microvirga sp. Mcv34 TaxID=2926016 RepID=UPI0021C89062|nr:calcium-binding protein [Microvirga sp. Mcv34]
MASSYEISSPTTVVGTWRTLAADDSVLVTAAGVLNADTGIASTVSGNRIWNLGTIAATNIGVRVGLNGRVENGGTITGRDQAVWLGADASSGGNYLINDGTIGDATTGVGVVVFGSAVIVNRSTIQGNTQAISTQAGSVSTITNFGTIEKLDPAISGNAIRSSSNVTLITNYGTIKGDISLGSGADIFDGRNGGIVAGTINLGGGNDTAYGGAGNDTFMGGGGDDYLDGGAGTDTALFVASSDITVDLRRTDAQSTGSGFDTLRDIENLSTVGNEGGNVTFIGSGGANDLRSDQGNDTLDGGSGSDTLDGGFGNDRLIGGDGFDTVLFTTVEEGGQGVYVNMANPADPLNIVATDTITGYGADTYIGIEALVGTKFADHFIGDGTKTVFTGGAGNDTIDGGGGGDVAKFTGARSQYAISAPDANGSVTVTYLPGGGDGADTIKNVRVLQFSDQAVALVNAAPTNVALSKTVLSETLPVHAVVATLSSVDADGDAVSYALANDAGGAFRLEGNNLVLNRALDYDTGPHQYTISVEATDQFGAKTSQSVTLDLTNVIETNPLVLIGTAGADALMGESGNDRLTGNAGKDVLTGGAGQDIFVFDRLAKTNTAHKRAELDTITDFNPADDTIWLQKSVFKGVAKKGVLAKAAFYAGTKAHDASDRIIYDKKKGALWYDADGTGWKAAIQIGQLEKNLKLTAADFFVV